MNGLRAERASANYSRLTFERAILDSLPANIAVIDASGEIVCVNAAWEQFARANDMRDASIGIGANYLDVCHAASADPCARAALKGIVAVMKGSLGSFQHIYPCHSPGQHRWFTMHAAPLVDYPDFFVISHEDVTEQIVCDE